MDTTTILILLAALAVVFFLVSRKKQAEPNYTDTVLGLGKRFGLF